MGEVPYIHGAGEPDSTATEFNDKAKALVDQWLAGVSAVRDGTYVMFLIEGSDDHSGVLVTPENVDEIDASLREHFAPFYPGLVTEGATPEA